jgi:hypothetical protein
MTMPPAIARRHQSRGEHFFRTSVLRINLTALAVRWGTLSFSFSGCRILALPESLADATHSLKKNWLQVTRIKAEVDV